MNPVTVLLCLEPRAPHWELGPLPAAAGPVALLRWRVDPAPADGGMPVQVQHLLARTFCAEGWMTFPRPDSQPAADVDDDAPAAGPRTRVLRPKAGAGRLTDLVQGRWTRTDWLATRDPAVALAAFEDPAHPWWLRGQVVLLSDAERGIPVVGDKLLDHFTGPDWAADAALLERHGVDGVLRPGVDGDVAALLVPCPARRERWLKRLAAECRAAGAALEIVDETGLAV